MEVLAQTDTDPNSFAISELSLYNTYTVESISPDVNIGDEEVNLRVGLHGCTVGAYAEYEILTRLHKVIDGQLVGPPIGGLAGGVGASRNTPGSDREVRERTLSVTVGDQVVLAPAFEFALAVPELGAPKAAAAAEVSLCPVTPGVALTSRTGADGNCGPIEEAGAFSGACGGDLELVSVVPVQVVFGGTLVADKPTVLKLSIDSSFDDPVDAEVTLEIEQNGLPPVILTDNVLVAPDCRLNYYLPDPSPTFGTDCDESESSPALSTLQDLGLDLPKGTFKATARVSAIGGGGSNAGNDEAQSSTVGVRATSLNLLYGDVACSLECASDPDAYGTVTQQEFDATIEWSNRHLLAMYPLAPQGLVTTRCDMCTVAGSTGPVCTGPDCKIFETDATRLEIAARDFGLLSGIDRLVAVVPPDYFAFHGASPKTVGVNTASVSGVDTVIVNVNGPTGVFNGVNDPVVPHELLHTYNVDHPVSAPGELPLPVPSGYWVGCQEELTAPGLNCEVPPEAERLMAAKSFTETSPPGIWIDANLYRATLLPILASAAPDPPLIGIIGSLSKNGTVTIDSALELPAGSVRPAIAGEYFVDMLDERGQVLSTTSHSARFKASWRVLDPTAAGPSEVETESARFTFVLAYPLETTSIQFRKNGTVLHAFDPMPMALKYVVDSIPAEAFAKIRDDDDSSDDDSKSDDDNKSDDDSSSSTESKRAALLKSVANFERRLRRNDRKGALRKLLQIRKAIDKNVAPFEGQINRDRLLGQIDMIAVRLETQTQ